MRSLQLFSYFVRMGRTGATPVQRSAISMIEKKRII